MKLKEILRALKPFANVAASFIPGGPAVVAAVNAFLPDDKKLTADAQGGQIMAAIEGLPPEQKASLLEKDIDLKISQDENWTARYREMVKADGQSTRPKIALMMAWLVVGETTVFMALLAWGVSAGGLAALNQPFLWTVFGVLTGLPAGLLGKYFGELRREQANRLGAGGGGLFGKILSALGK